MKMNREIHEDEQPSFEDEQPSFSDVQAIHLSLAGSPCKTFCG
jgi:hypothetical protein